MREIPVKDLKQSLADVINRCAFGGERAIITRHGKGVVALVSIEDLALLEKEPKKSERQKPSRASQITAK